MKKNHSFEKSLKLIFPSIIFLAAFLSFSVQPLFSKVLLPYFGGSAMVWTTSSLFFQLVLLTSYVYVFFLEKLSWKKHLLLQLLVISAIFLALRTTVFGQQLSFEQLPYIITKFSSANEFTQILSLGIISVGLAFFFLGTVSTSLQVLAARLGIHNPYSFYRASNIGSLLGLFSFPFILEPLLPTKVLVYSWSLLASVTSILVVVLYLFVNTSQKITDIKIVKTKLPKFLDMMRWSALAAFPVALFLAVTNQITLGVAPIPYLWILPFGAYLVSYILAFGIYKVESLMTVSAIVLSIAGLVSLTTTKLNINGYFLQLLILLLVTLIVVLISHTLAYKSRPDKASLSYFYLSLAFGGMLGGLFVSVVAPLIFTSYIELQLLLIIAIIFTLLLYSKLPQIDVLLLKKRRVVSVKFLTYFSLITFLLFLSITLINPENRHIIFSTRNFYGTLKITDDGSVRKLSNGTIIHGSQLLGENKHIPTTYYTPSSGVGKTITHLQSMRGDAPVRIGVIGLGSGSLAAYCRSTDKMTFYEINQQVVDVAQKYFSYLEQCPTAEIKVGDARIVLQNEAKLAKSEKFDVLVVDAFTDDAIPTHLMTLEATQLYLSLLENDGALLFHISNRYLNLDEVLQASAKLTQTQKVKMINHEANPDIGEVSSVWVLLTKSDEVLKVAEHFQDQPPATEEVVWTDGFSNTLRVLRLF